MVSPVPILFVDHAPAMGGAENSLKLLLEQLDSQRWELHLACAGELLADKVSHNVTVHRLQFPQLRRSITSPIDWYRGSHLLARIARTINAQVVISNTIRASLYAGPAAKLASTAFVWIMRDFWLGESPPRNVCIDNTGKRLLCWMANSVIANSHATAAHLSCTSKITVIHNGISLEYFTTALDSNECRSSFHLPDNSQVVGMVGRLRPWKGQERFMRVLKYVLDEYPQTHALIVGGTPFSTNHRYEVELLNLTRGLDIQDRVTFTGHLDDIRPALAAMDIFVHPGEPEPFGLVNIEAMAMAKPVVAFAHGALPEIVTDGETGVLIPAGDEHGMAQAICKLLKDPSQQLTMGLAGRRRVEQLFSIRRTAQAFDQVLKTVVAKAQ
jgi:glycosyltransferase involved in cell wall biosynthesis